ncbi:hypothetical protein [Spiroplasma endosymbiont of 'Nebria riversi']|uniref:hypothetical protein n=1 Tax=Spiroplasma endosymbiont of 'Nebria riversi' TaxID=2792084 RepID=UPI001C043FFA|nr:hypothetical protein [Spiroplasma endosymbiont of 'Nebria riversi']
MIIKSLFFKYNNKNADLKYKEIKNIDINNLNFSNVKVTRDSKLLHSADFQNPCFEKKTYNNKSSLSKIIVIPPCEYNSKSKLVFQITTGLTKTKQENKLNGWNINPDDEMKLSDFINLNNKQSEIINELSSEFDLSNTNKQEQEMILHSFDKKQNLKQKLTPKNKRRLNIQYNF